MKMEAARSFETLEHVVRIQKNVICRMFILPSVLLGAFEKLRKASISFVMYVYVCFSVCMEELDFHWTDFYDIWNLSIFRKSVEKIHVSLKYDKNDGYFP